HHLLVQVLQVVPRLPVHVLVLGDDVAHEAAGGGVVLAPGLVVLVAGHVPPLHGGRGEVVARACLGVAGQLLIGGKRPAVAADLQPVVVLPAPADADPGGDAVEVVVADDEALAHEDREAGAWRGVAGVDDVVAVVLLAGHAPDQVLGAEGPQAGGAA